MRVTPHEALQSDLSLALASTGPIELRAHAELPLPARFRAVADDFSRQFGTPDSSDDSALIAVWDFDYYRLSLRVVGALLLLQKHQRQ